MKLPPLREVIARHGLQASKALGQNFLLDGQLLDRIAAVPGALTDVPVYEVGPGPGGLTRALLKAGARVTAVERDRRCLPALAELSDAYPGRLTVIEGADRIVATPASDAYGRRAILAQWRSKARLALPVHRSAFTPPPKVMSAVVHIEPSAMPTGVEGARLEQITAAAFGQRRKMLRQSLKSMPQAIAALEELQIDSARRAETLTIEEFVAVARLVTAAAAQSR